MTVPFRWPQGYRGAVSLTYDDAVPVHYEQVGPQLEAHGLRGTFFLNIATDPIRNPERWRELAARGHELGNHTLFHPCRRYPRSRHPWLHKSFDLRHYTPERLRLEVQVASAFLRLLDGRSERTFAHTCHDTHIGWLWNERSISELIRDDFVAARAEQTGRPVFVSPSLDLMHLGCYGADGGRFEVLRDHIRVAEGRGGWMILGMHGVGGDSHNTFIDPGVHAALLDWLAGQSRIWVRPFLEVAKWVRDWQTGQYADAHPLGPNV